MFRHQSGAALNASRLTGCSKRMVVVPDQRCERLKSTPTGQLGNSQTRDQNAVDVTNSLNVCVLVLDLDAFMKMLAAYAPRLN